jgi:endonuclease-3
LREKPNSPRPGGRKNADGKIEERDLGGISPPRSKSASAARRPRSAAAWNAQRIQRLLELLDQEFPDADCALEHETPFQLLVATILSAQCTDERVNATTPALFAAYPTAETLAVAEQAEVEAIVNPLGFFRAKAKNIREMAQMLVRDHDGEVPRSLDELVLLSGVGRKTANVVLGVCYGLATGVVVDTHVRRISGLLGLTKSTDPVKIEQDLIRLLPPEKWILFSHQIILHGRKTCIARRPRCVDCPLLAVCGRLGLPDLAE